MYDTLGCAAWSLQAPYPVIMQPGGRCVRCQVVFVTYVALPRNNPVGAGLPEFRLNPMASLLASGASAATWASAAARATCSAGTMRSRTTCCRAVAAAAASTLCSLPDGLLYCSEAAAPAALLTQDPSAPFVLHPANAHIWTALWVGTGGAAGSWTVSLSKRASCAREQPCGCGDGAAQFALCAGGRVTNVVLPSASVRGRFPDPEMHSTDQLKQLVLGGTCSSSSFLHANLEQHALRVTPGELWQCYRVRPGHYGGRAVRAAGAPDRSP